MRSERIVIIGAGPGGCAAAIQCRRLGFTPLILERTGRIGGLVKNAYEVENYPALAPTAGPLLAEKLAGQLERLALPITMGELIRIAPDSKPGRSIEIEVAGLGAGPAASDARDQPIATDRLPDTPDRTAIATDRLIIATGTTPLHLSIPGAAAAHGETLFYEVFDLLNSYCWRQMPDQKRRIAVIGGGEAALNYSLTLARAGASVTLLVRGERFTAIGKLVDFVESISAIEVDLSTVSIEIHPVGDQLRLTVDQRGKRSDRVYDAIVCAIGRQSRIGDLLSDYQPGVLQSITTGRSGLYVIGDARSGALGQVAIAAGDGLAAAAAAISGLK